MSSFGTWSYYLHGRTTDVKANLRFFTQIFGMKVLRHEEFDKPCAITCNGEFDTPWSKTMIGYGPEDENFCLELTYNYGVENYDVGTGLTHVAVVVENPKVSFEAQAQFGRRTPYGEGAMPGPWVQGDVNPGWIKGQHYEPGSFIELVVYDDTNKAQGKVLAEVKKTGAEQADGRTLMVDFLCVEDPHLQWWCKTGPGKDSAGKRLVHLCQGTVRRCKANPRKKESIFHTDMVRPVGVGDINRRISSWWIVGSAKKDFEAARSRILKAAKADDMDEGNEMYPPELGVDEFGLPLSEDEVEVEGAKGEAGLAAKLAKLKRDAAPKGEGVGKEVAKKKDRPVKGTPAAKAGSSTKERKKAIEAGQADATGPAKKKAKAATGAWFGRPGDGGGDDPEPSSQSSESSSSKSSGKKAKKKSRKKKKEKEVPKGRSRTLRNWKEGFLREREDGKEPERLRRDGGGFSSGGSGEAIAAAGADGVCGSQARSVGGSIVAENAGADQPDRGPHDERQPGCRDDENPSGGGAVLPHGDVPAEPREDVSSPPKGGDDTVPSPGLRSSGRNREMRRPARAETESARAQHVRLELDSGAVPRTNPIGGCASGRYGGTEDGHERAGGRSPSPAVAPSERRRKGPALRGRSRSNEGQRKVKEGEEQGKRRRSRGGQDSASIASKGSDEVDPEEDMFGVDEDEGVPPLGVSRGKRPEGIHSKDETIQMIKNIVANQTSYSSLGLKLIELLESADTPFGRFVREYSSSQPQPALRPPHERKGDLLPIAPECITTELEGVTRENLRWTQVVVMALNFHYCCGWSKPICVPIEKTLSENQKVALKALGDMITRNVISADVIPPMGEIRQMMNSKRFDYAGNPVDHMQDLLADRVIPMWPKPGHAGVRCITEFLDDELLASVRDPTGWWLPDDCRPVKRTRSRVRASDETWFQLCKAARARNMMKMVPDHLLHKDRAGHYITNGAGGVLKRKEVNGRMEDFQRFISVLIPTNEHSEQLPGEQDSLPYVGQLTGIVLQPEEDIYLDSEDLTSAFNLFSVPDTWLPHFAFSKRVDASAFGGTPGLQVTPALCVIPMGWKSAVTLVQAAVRKIVYGLCRVPRETEVRKDMPLPGTRDLSVVYLDNFDELRRLRKFGEGLSEGTISEYHQRFITVCDQLGLGRNEAKQLVMSLTGGIQGGELDGETGVLKVASDKLRNFLCLSLGLLGSDQWREFHIRHWTGKAAFIAAFKRPLFSILEQLFPAIERSTAHDIIPGTTEFDEVLTFLILSVTAESDLRAQVLTEVSCSDASPTGGGSAVATKFKAHSLTMPDELEFSGKCIRCNRDLNTDGRDGDVITGPDGYQFRVLQQAWWAWLAKCGCERLAMS
eukprot:Skav205737  [mRNA]  locus=scaffold1496:189452:197472:+ [translate_table: standard]